MLSFVTWNVDPILIHWGLNGGIRWYGLLWALGIYLCYLVQVRLYKNEHCPADWADKIFVWMTLGVIIGARLGHCWFYEWHLTDNPIQLFAWNINYRNPYIEHPMWLLRIWEGGLSSHGGALGLIVASWLLNKKHFSKRPEYHTSLVWIFDRLVIGVCITATLIRLGNLMNSEIYGGPTNLPWGFIFVRDGQTVPCHPTQIYEMLYCIVAFVVTWCMYWYGKCYRRQGLIFGVFLEIIFATRFLLEFIKFDQEAFEANLFLNMGQLLSIPFIVWGIYLIVHALRTPATPEFVPRTSETKHTQSNLKH
ncbi:MAG: prolipoprotein diacylglyceryl transferase [Bacteroidales bacterium]|nr:prolipoprotein diacylglyceryl transferase [Candidatus Colicola coprequi]